MISHGPSNRTASPRSQVSLNPVGDLQLAGALEQNGVSTGPYPVDVVPARHERHPMAHARYLIAQNAFCAAGLSALASECQVCQYGSKVWIERAASITADKYHNAVPTR